MTGFDRILAGGDLRSMGKSNSIVAKIQDQKDFDKLFKCLFHADRFVVMRSADAVEKITVNAPQFLCKHKREILQLCVKAKDKELKWHLAQLLPRLDLTAQEQVKAWDILAGWAKDKASSRIVRVNAIHGLFELLSRQSKQSGDFRLILLELEKENIPSINARIRQIKKRFS